MKSVRASQCVVVSVVGHHHDVALLVVRVQRRHGSNVRNHLHRFVKHLLHVSGLTAADADPTVDRRETGYSRDKSEGCVVRRRTEEGQKDGLMQ